MNKYEGVLARPYDRDYFSDWNNPEGRERLIAFLERRETALFEHFEIEQADDSDAWRKLARALAARHVPAYRKKPGRPKEVRYRERDWAILYHTAKGYFGGTSQEVYEFMSDAVSVNGKTFSPTQVENLLKKYAQHDREGWKHAKEHAAVLLEQSAGDQKGLTDALGIANTTHVLEFMLSHFERDIENWPQSHLSMWGENDLFWSRFL